MEAVYFYDLQLGALAVAKVPSLTVRSRRWNDTTSSPSRASGNGCHTQGPNGGGYWI